MNPSQIISARFPYLPVMVAAGESIVTFDALVDSGFDGDIMVPEGMDVDLHAFIDYSRWTLIDGSRVRAPNYLASVQIGTFDPVPAALTTFGREPLIGRRLLTLYRVILDHGLKVIVEL